MLIIIDKRNLDLEEFKLDQIEEIKESQELLNPFITISSADYLAKRLEELNSVEQKGPLHKLPFGVKDNIDTVDWPTTGACKSLHGLYPK